MNGNESAANLKVLYKKPSCGNICNEFKSCFNCTYSHNECVWCANQAKCVLSKAIQVYFPFGECINYITERSQCDTRLGSGVFSLPQLFPYSNNANSAVGGSCSGQYSNCSACIRDEKCGWCTRDTAVNNENETNQTLLARVALNTGAGMCMEGGDTNSSGFKCKNNWFFSQCPLCECNGHTVCGVDRVGGNNIEAALNKTEPASLAVKSERKTFLDEMTDSLVFNYNSHSTCGKCMNNTDGEYCSQCRMGFYGNPKNNGSW